MFFEVLRPPAAVNQVRCPNLTWMPGTATYSLSKIEKRVRQFHVYRNVDPGHIDACR